ncbi:DUF6930 domain-containing protein [Leptolyngbya ohadii]|uniref:DUF6930 domain-containing protein n=1 Tax=Leptolyngbya ohadii TaxID=1962290 RepID=UPI000B5A093E|nr:hypothetical protein [Leptolyngbya ohadii]
MTALNPSTRRRLQQLRQIPSVWEGDRRLLMPEFAVGALEAAGRKPNQCVLWVDGSEGMVRGMEMVSGDVGHEAIVRTLLQAMEYPQGAALPARPQKIVVRDREIQFFLRGVLQDLDIAIEYAPELPIIDEIFEGLQSAIKPHPPQLPPEYEVDVLEATADIWNDAPWEVLDEEKILSVEITGADVGPLYVSVLGMLGMEYGLLMYRSIESLKQFRQRVLAAGDSPEGLEEAFLEQDCLFVTFEQDGELRSEDESTAVSAFYAEAGVLPTFGNLHPLEGMRPILHEEEATTVLLALKALHKFFQKSLQRLEQEDFPAISGSYRIPDPNDASRKLSIKVATMPALADELSEMTIAAGFPDEDFPFSAPPLLNNHLVPTDSFYSLGAMSWDILEFLRRSVKFHQPAGAEFPAEGDGFPVILIQTSRPKATELIEALKAAGGLKAICFNPGEDPFSEDRYDLGVLQTEDGELHLFGEFQEDDEVHIQARKKWDQRCKKTKGYCGLIIARGLKGASSGNPQFNDMMALFETRYISAQELGLGELQLIPYLE